MTYAIIEIGGTQIRVEAGRFYDVNRMAVEPDQKVTLEEVLLLKHEDDLHVGQPYVAGATIETTVLEHRRGRKILVYKMRPKKKTRKRQGHRQELTRLMVNAIRLGDDVLAEVAMAETLDDMQAAEEETPAAEMLAVEEVAEVAETAAIAEEVPAETTAVEVEDSASEVVAETTAEAEAPTPEAPAETSDAAVEPEAPEVEEPTAEAVAETTAEAEAPAPEAPDTVEEPEAIAQDAPTEEPEAPAPAPEADAQASEAPTEAPAEETPVEGE